MMISRKTDLEIFPCNGKQTAVGKWLLILSMKENGFHYPDDQVIFRQLKNYPKTIQSNLILLLMDLVITTPPVF